MFADVKTKLSERWALLSERDQKSVIVLSVSLLVAIIIFGIVMPLVNAHNNAKNSLANAETTYQELLAIAPQALANGQSTPAFSISSLNSEIRRQAVRHGLSIQRFEPQGDNLRVWLEGARYPSVVKWLAGLESMGITQAELTLDDENKPGFVSVRVTFALPKN
ncbi:type II secretion system protein M [Reinekea forsetii]|nr:type II secretion system protein M [Reinekea forsetii]